MDKVTLFKISETEEYNKNTNCGQLKMQAASTLSNNRFNLRVQIKRGVETIYPQQLKIIDRDGQTLPYEIWSSKEQFFSSNDQITEKKIKIGKYRNFGYFFETPEIKGVRFWADSLISKNNVFCSIDTLAISK